MKTENFIENNLDEVTFEKRNKNYGAYYLRKSYDKNVSAALTIAITVVFVIVAIPLIANYLNSERILRNNTIVGAEIMRIDKVKDVITPPELPPPPVEKIAERVKFRVPVVGTDTTDQGPLFTQAELNTQVNNEKIDDSDIKVDPEQKEKKVIDDDFNNTIYNITVVEEKPEYPGGYDNMYVFLSEHIKYPEIARIYKIQGTVYVSFIVEPEGNLTNIKIEKGIGAGCDEEAERVVRLMPNWTPGKQNNKNVRVQVMVPIRFMVVQ